MQLASLFAVVAVLAIPALADNNNGTYAHAPSVDPAINLGLMNYLDFLNKTSKLARVHLRSMDIYGYNYCVFFISCTTCSR